MARVTARPGTHYPACTLIGRSRLSPGRQLVVAPRRGHSEAAPAIMHPVRFDPRAARIKFFSASLALFEISPIIVVIVADGPAQSHARPSKLDERPRHSLLNEELVCPRAR